MNIYPLVFSNNPKYRLTRHVLFWMLWILYYTVEFILYWSGKYPFYKVFFTGLTEVTVSTIIDIVFCYSIIYFLLPQFLFKGRYISMVFLWLLFSFIYLVSFRLFSVYISPPIRDLFGMPPPVLTKNLLWLFFYNFSQINMEGCLAAAI